MLFASLLLASLDSAPTYVLAQAALALSLSIQGTVFLQALRPRESLWTMWRTLQAQYHNSFISGLDDDSQIVVPSIRHNVVHIDTKLVSFRPR